MKSGKIEIGMHFSSVDLLGVTIHVVSVPDVLGYIDYVLDSPDRKAIITYVNIYGMNLAWADNEFREIINKSSLVFCDGHGLKLGAFLAGLKLGQRMTPPDWIDRLFEDLARKRKSVFFLGDEDSVLEPFVNHVSTIHPNLRVAGFNNGFFDKAFGSRENEALVDRINRSSADVLLVGMGMPIQEKWCYYNLDRLRVKILLPVGAMYRWYSGVARKAPRWVTNVGMEWFYRLLLEPRRLWRRYLIGNPQFLLRVILSRMGLIKF